MNHREDNVETYLRKRIKAQGGMALKLVRLAGFPDRLVLLPGGVIQFVEVKRPKGGVLAEHQGLAHDLLRRLGQTVQVLNTKERIDTWLTEITSKGC